MTGFQGWLADAAEPEGCYRAEQSCRDCGDGAQEALGVAGVVVEATGVDGSLEDDDDVTVEPGCEVPVGVEDGHVVGGYAEAGDGNESHQRPVADEQADGDREERAGSLGGETDETGDEIAGCDPGEDSEDAEMGVVKVRVETEEEVENEDDGTAAEDVEGEFAAGFASADA